MNKISIVILVVLALLIGLVTGFYLAGMSKSIMVSSNKASTSVEEGNYKNTFADGWRAAKEKLNQASMGSTMTIDGGKSVYGVVKEVSEGKVILETSLRNPLDDESLKVRKVLADKAKIVVRKRKEQAQLDRDRLQAEKEMKVINERMTSLERELFSCSATVSIESDICADKRNEKARLLTQNMELNSKLMNEYYELANASLNDIKPGYYIFVRTAEDVSEKTDFSAVEIETTDNMIAPIPILPTVDAAVLTPPSPANVPASVPAASETPAAPILE